MRGLGVNLVQQLRNAVQVELPVKDDLGEAERGFVNVALHCRVHFPIRLLEGGKQLLGGDLFHAGTIAQVRA